MKNSPVARHSAFLTASVSSNALVVLVIIILISSSFQGPKRVPAQLAATCLLAILMAASSLINRRTLLELLAGRGEPWVNTAAGARLTTEDNGQPDRPADKGLFAHGTATWTMDVFHNTLTLFLIDLSLLIGTAITNGWGVTAKPLPLGPHFFMMVAMLFLTWLALTHVRRAAECPGESLFTVLFALLAKRAGQQTFLDPASSRVRRVYRLPGEAADQLRATAPRGFTAPQAT